MAPCSLKVKQGKGGARVREDGDGSIFSFVYRYLLDIRPVLYIIWSSSLSIVINMGCTVGVLTNVAGTCASVTALPLAV